MNESALRTLQQAGYKVPEVPQYLGEGCYAKTYVLDDTRVFKITTDRTDAQTAAWVNRAQRNGMCRNLVRIDKVWKLKETGGWDGRRPLHLIVAERLVPVPRIYFDRWQLPRYMRALGNVSFGPCDLGVEAFNDFHLDNVMYRPGDRVVLSDFGSATTPPTEIEEGC